MRVEFYGVRGGAATSDEDKLRYGGNTNSIVIMLKRQPNHLFLLDAGTGLARYSALHMDSSQAYSATVLLSHLHLYHIIGFQFTPLAFSPLCQTRVIGPNTRNFALESVFDHIMSPSYSPVYGLSNLMSEVTFEEASPERRFINGMTIDSTPFFHSNMTDSWGYRLSAVGHSVTYLTDARLRLPDGSIDSNAVGLASGVDVLIAGAFDPAHERRHRSTYADVIELAYLSACRRVIFTHHHPSVTDAALDKLQAKLSQHYPDLNIQLAYEGLCLDL